METLKEESERITSNVSEQQQQKKIKQKNSLTSEKNMVYPTNTNFAVQLDDIFNAQNEDTIEEIEHTFSKKYSQFDEIYTQIRDPSLASARTRLIQQKHQQKAPKQLYLPPGVMQKLNVKCLKKIFSFLNVVELIVLARVCKAYKRMVNQEPDLFINMDLLAIPTLQSSDFNKLVEKGKALELLKLPVGASSSDTTCMLICVHSTIRYLQLTNINIDFANVFIKEMPRLQTLIIENHTNRQKQLDDLEIMAITKQLLNLRHLAINKNPVIDQSIQIFLQNFKQLVVLELLGCHQLTNKIFSIIAKNLKNIKVLKVGGLPKQYNTHITVQGFRTICASEIKLEHLVVEYASKIGDEAIDVICAGMGDTMKEFHNYRNCFEKCVKISDAALASFHQSRNIQRLTIQYSRKFRNKIHLFLASNFPKLEYLNLRDCPVQEPLNIIATGCPFLREVDFSGDSWVRSTSLVGLSQHKFLQIFHMGHFEHGDTQCDKNLQEYPPKGMFIESIFKRTDAFPMLHTLYLERECSLTYWLDIRIQSIRPKLAIKYTAAQDLLTKE